MNAKKIIMVTATLSFSGMVLAHGLFDAAYQNSKQLSQSCYKNVDTIKYAGINGVALALLLVQAKLLYGKSITVIDLKNLVQEAYKNPSKHKALWLLLSSAAAFNGNYGVQHLLQDKKELPVQKDPVVKNEPEALPVPPLVPQVPVVLGVPENNNKPAVPPVVLKEVVVDPLNQEENTREVANNVAQQIVDGIVATVLNDGDLQPEGIEQAEKIEIAAEKLERELLAVIDQNEYTNYLKRDKVAIEEGELYKAFTAEQQELVQQGLQTLEQSLYLMIRKELVYKRELEAKLASNTTITDEERMQMQETIKAVLAAEKEEEKQKLAARPEVVFVVQNFRDLGLIQAF